MYDLEVILPVHNGKDTIAAILAEWVKELNRHKITYRFLVCEDGSTDNTKEHLQKLKDKFPIRILSYRHRLGYGGAVINGLLNTQSNYILCVDSDGQYDPGDFPKFWQNRDKADVVFGWRVRRSDPLHRIIFSGLFKIAFSVLFVTPVHDPSNPFVLFKRKKIIPYIGYLSFLSEGFWWGFIGMCDKKQLTLFEVPIQHRKRLQGTTSIFHLKNIFSIAVKNFAGLIRLKMKP